MGERGMDFEDDMIIYAEKPRDCANRNEERSASLQDPKSTAFL